MPLTATFATFAHVDWAIAYRQFWPVFMVGAWMTNATLTALLSRPDAEQRPSTRFRRVSSQILSSIADLVGVPVFVLIYVGLTQRTPVAPSTADVAIALAFFTGLVAMVKAHLWGWHGFGTKWMIHFAALCAGALLLSAGCALSIPTGGLGI